MNIGIYIYDDAEVLDFSGPYEVFSVAKRLLNSHWNVILLSEKGTVVSARGDYLVQPHYSISNHPPLDLLLVVGGIHAEEVKKDNVIQWIARVAGSAEIVASVCTGCFLLAEAGLLKNLPVTTHWEDIPDLRIQYPDLEVVENRPWIRTGKFITSGGISAGIDMSLFLVSELSSMAMAEKTAKQMEYRWNKNA